MDIHRDTRISSIWTRGCSILLTTEVPNLTFPVLDGSIPSFSADKCKWWRSGSVRKFFRSLGNAILIGKSTIVIVLKRQAILIAIYRESKLNNKQPIFYSIERRFMLSVNSYVLGILAYKIIGYNRVANKEVSSSELFNSPH